MKAYIKGVAPCPVCGVSTRSARAAAADFPGTSVRSGRGLCQNCYRTALKTEREARGPGAALYPVTECTSPDCTVMTRSTLEHPDAAPGTRVRVSGGLCTACYKRRDRPLDITHTVQGLGSFLARRNARIERLQRVAS